jgi:hypothetical protein
VAARRERRLRAAISRCSRDRTLRAEISRCDSAALTLTRGDLTLRAAIARAAISRCAPRSDAATPPPRSPPRIMLTSMPGGSR